MHISHRSVSVEMILKTKTIPFQLSVGSERSIINFIPLLCMLAGIFPGKIVLKIPFQAAKADLMWAKIKSIDFELIQRGIIEAGNQFSSNFFSFIATDFYGPLF